jgi:hypothetical protein
VATLIGTSKGGRRLVPISFSMEQETEFERSHRVAGPVGSGIRGSRAHQVAPLLEALAKFNIAVAGRFCACVQACYS